MRPVDRVIALVGSDAVDGLGLLDHPGRALPLGPVGTAGGPVAKAGPELGPQRIGEGRWDVVDRFVDHREEPTQLAIAGVLVAHRFTSGS